LNPSMKLHRFAAAPPLSRELQRDAAPAPKGVHLISQPVGLLPHGNPLALFSAMARHQLF